MLLIYQVCAVCANFRLFFTPREIEREFPEVNIRHYPAAIREGVYMRVFQQISVLRSDNNHSGDENPG